MASENEKHDNPFSRKRGTKKMNPRKKREKRTGHARLVVERMLTMESKHNALAELAERMKWLYCEVFYHIGHSEADDIDKAQRIIAELAKVEDVTKVHNLELVKLPNSWQCYDAVAKCRAIADEGLRK